jgi:hypothetical protein
MRFTNSNKPTLNQIDNDIGHTLQNAQFACLLCNRLKSNKDENITWVGIKLKNFALFHNLPTMITNADTIRHLEGAKFGGLSNVMHRENVARRTHINHFKFQENKVYSKESWILL